MSAPTDALVSPDWLEAHLDDPAIRLIDVSRPATAEYHTDHIPGAQRWGYKDMLWDPLVRDFPAPEEFARRCGGAGIGNDTTVVFYGDIIQFGTYGWWVFAYCGHGHARVLEGGRKRWADEGRPVTTVVPNPKPVAYAPAARNEDMRARRDDVLKALGRADAVLLDHRSAEEYRGELVAPPGTPNTGAERAGRIPGAKHLHFTDLLAADESFKSADELRALLAVRGVTGGEDIVCYCRLSHRATLAYFALSRILGFERVRSYDGSWTEWGSIVGVPIER
ncbi:MAG: sulfurtransferase [Myxococcota bacterium]|jgi:thiosulfate/3-mercaptopyruvate sulfurtransferase|nr:sulfurtransferase [Myxococcota bacterium]